MHWKRFGVWGSTYSMSDAQRPLTHLLAGIEELLRAGADAAVLWRRQVDAHAPSGSADGGWSWWGELARSIREDGFTEELRAALEREATRWELRSDGDPAAGRVRDLFEALLDLLEPSAEAAPRTPEGGPDRVQRQAEDRVRTPGTRAPGQGVQR